MGKATVTYRELRFLIAEELTEVYVLCVAGGDAPLGLQGWHHKVFPPSKSVETILAEMFGSDACELWPRAAPPR